MKRITIAALAATLLAAGCSDSTYNRPGEGDLNVEYDFQGVESPDKVSVYIVDGKETGWTCANMPYNPADDAFDHVRNLPLTGTTDFAALPESGQWIVWAIGTASGVHVADACRDRVRIRRDELTSVILTLENTPLRAQGKFNSDLELSFDLPSEAIGTLVAFDIACQSFDINEDLCKISNAVANLLTDLDVKAAWQINQNGDAIRGTMEWIEVEGKDVGPEWKLVEGGFNGEVPGATQVEITTYDMKVNMDQLVLFMIQEVMGYDLDDYGPQVELVIDGFVSDLVFYDGYASLYDNNFDGQAESISGVFDAQIDLPAFDYEHRFDLGWTAYRD